MKNFKNNRFTSILYFMLFLVIVVFIIIWFYNLNNNNNTTYFQKYVVSSKHADVVFNANDSVMHVTIKYKDLTGVSGIHIHVNNNGTPGPILAWLGTTTAWQRGVKQNTPGTNSPCCTRNNPKCTLTAPEGTPYLSKELENTEKTFVFYKKCGTSKCKSQCPWLENGVLLDSHGFNFQQVIDGVLTKEAPGLDLIENTPFQKVN